MEEEDRYDDNDPRKPPPPGGGFDPQQFKNDPMALLKASKKGKVIMMFVSVAGNPSKKETEQITARWQTSLFNAQFQIERYYTTHEYVLSVIFVLLDFLFYKYYLCIHIYVKSVFYFSIVQFLICRSRA